MTRKIILLFIILLPTVAFCAHVLIVISPTQSCKRLETVMAGTGENLTSLEASFVARLTADMQKAGHTVTVERPGSCAYCGFTTVETADVPTPPRETNALLRLLKRNAVHRGVNTTSPDAKTNATAALAKYDYVVYVTRMDFRRPFWASSFQPGTRQLVMDYEILSTGGTITKGCSLRQNMVMLKKINKESLQYLIRTAASHLASAIKEK